MKKAVYTWCFGKWSPAMLNKKNVSYSGINMSNTLSVHLHLSQSSESSYIDQ